MAFSSEQLSHHDTSEEWMKVLDNFLDNETTEEASPKDGHICESKFQEEEKSASTYELECDSTNNSGEVYPDTNSPSIGDPLVVSEPSYSALVQESIGESASICSNFNSPPPIVTEEDADTKVQSRSERKRDREKQRRSDVNSQFSALASLLKKVESNPEDFDSDVDTDEESDTLVGSKKKLKRLPLLTVPSTNVCSEGAGLSSNRVDLIAKTIIALEKLCELNDKRRKDCRELTKELRGTKKLLNEAPFKKETELVIDFQTSAANVCYGADSGKTKTITKPQQPVMMMVPMMVSPESISHQNGMPTSGVPSMYPYPMPYMNPSNGMHGNVQHCYPVPTHHQPAPSSPHQIMMPSSISNGHPTGHGGWQPAMASYSFQQDAFCSQFNPTSNLSCGVPSAGVPPQGMQMPMFHSSITNLNSHQQGRLISTPPYGQSPGANNNSQISPQPQVPRQHSVGKASSYGGNLAHCA